MIRFLILFFALINFSCTSTISKAWPPKDQPTCQVQLETSKGIIVIDIHSDWAPIASKRFIDLVKDNYYNGCVFYRVIKCFIAQTGINVDTNIYTKWNKSTIVDEKLKIKNYKYTVCMAKSRHPNSASTQFFINLKDNFSLLKYEYSPFGIVSSGMDVVDNLFAEYGECSPMAKGPDQKRVIKEGNKYLNEYFPNLDWIKKASIIN
jgi:peptidyl-prolyl cis-trans isomerase A (cyclophilin A)